jgi:ElaB/YqjD/DUF883 family membrane-anchored ribosome-binding protein
MNDPKDHDILIEIKTQVTRLISDVKEIKDDTARRVDAMEQEKLSKDDFQVMQMEHEAAHKRLEKAQSNQLETVTFLVQRYWIAVGVLGVVDVLLGVAISYLIKHLP